MSSALNNEEEEEEEGGTDPEEWGKLSKNSHVQNHSRKGGEGGGEDGGGEDGGGEGRQNLQ